MGDRWGPEGPPPEAYERVTNPERFAPLHDIALDLLERLDREFDVTREEGYGLDPLEREDLVRPTVRLKPTDPEAGPLTIRFSKFPGIGVRLGHWFAVSFPGCGCDACDETVEEGKEDLERLVDALTSGSFSQAIELPPVGQARSFYRLPNEHGSTALSREEARARIDRAGGRRQFDYAPWPRRAQAVDSTRLG